VSTPDLESLRAKLVGKPLPGGSFEVPAYRAWISHAAMNSPAMRAGVLHPVWIVLGSLHGMGVPMDYFAHLMTADPATAVLGEITVEQYRTLEDSRAYSVVGQISKVERRTGKRGVLDFLDFQLDVFDAEQRVASSTQTFIFPRQDTA
jgi:hypothetical protein